LTGKLQQTHRLQFPQLTSLKAGNHETFDHYLDYKTFERNQLTVAEFDGFWISVVSDKPYEIHRIT